MHSAERGSFDCNGEGVREEVSEPQRIQGEVLRSVGGKRSHEP